MPDLEIEPLLSALEGDVPCGVDLEYDAAFLALLEAGAGKPETQWAAAVPAEWSSVLDKAKAWAAKRDEAIAMKPAFNDDMWPAAASALGGLGAGSLATRAAGWLRGAAQGLGLAF